MYTTHPIYLIYTVYFSCHLPLKLIYPINSIKKEIYEHWATAGTIGWELEIQPFGKDDVFLNFHCKFFNLGGGGGSHTPIPNSHSVLPAVAQCSYVEVPACAVARRPHHCNACTTHIALHCLATPQCAVCWLLTTELTHTWLGVDRLACGWRLWRVEAGGGRRKGAKMTAHCDCARTEREREGEGDDVVVPRPTPVRVRPSLH